jgi:hypothetical protein
MYGILMASCGMTYLPSFMKNCTKCHDIHIGVHKDWFSQSEVNRGIHVQTCRQQTYLYFFKNKDSAKGKKAKSGEWRYSSSFLDFGTTGR